MAEQLKKGAKLLWYQIDSVLGRGGFGITYLATDTNLNIQVAIKEYLPGDIAERKENSYIIPKTGTDGEMYRWGLTRFIEEAQILARFKHNNIVRVLSVFEENNSAYMVMEYEHGNNLELMLRTPLYQNEAKLVEVFDAILSGLEQVHAHNIIHRDIKPANIYVREDGSPVLLDFGSARQHVTDSTQNMTRILTKGYAPYEQMDNSAGPQGPWTDIYAVGATLYYAIRRELPPDAFHRFSRVVQKQPDPYIPSIKVSHSSQYSAGFLHAIDQALEFDARNRPQDALTFRKLLKPEGFLNLPVQPVTHNNVDSDATIIAGRDYPSNNSIPVTGRTAYGGQPQKEEISLTPINNSTPSHTDPQLSVGSASDQAAVDSISKQPNGLIILLKSKKELLYGALLATVIISGIGGYFLNPFNPQNEPIIGSGLVQDQKLLALSQKADSEQTKPAQERASREGQARLAQEKLDREGQARLAQEKLDREGQARLAQEKLDREEQARLAQEKLDREEQARLAQEKFDREGQARLAQEKLDREGQARLAQEKLDREEQARLAQEKFDREGQARLAQEKFEREEKARLAQEKLEREEQEQRGQEKTALEEKNRIAQALVIQQRQDRIKAEEIRLAELKRIEAEEKARLIELEKEEKEIQRKARQAKLKKDKLQTAKNRAAKNKKADGKNQKIILAKNQKPKKSKKKKKPISRSLLNERRRQDSESDIQSISRLFNDFKVNLESCNTRVLDTRTNPNKDSLAFVNRLCAEYQDMNLKISNFQSNSKRGFASANINIRQLTNKSGSTVLPGKSWSKFELKTTKSDGYWSLVKW